jgi:GTPase
MFATLDPTARQLELPSRRHVLLSDTVGFIRNLPHTLIDAFRATLEEVVEAEMLLLVSDAASASRAQQDEQVRQVLDEIGAGDKTVLRIANKADLLSPEVRGTLAARGVEILISAKTGEGIPELLTTIDQNLTLDPIEHLWLRFGLTEGRQLSSVYDSGRVLRREDSDGAILIEAEIPHSLAERLRDHVQENISPVPRSL